MATTKSAAGARKTPAKKTPARKAPVKSAEADITIAIEPPKPITVNLGGTGYTVRPIKGSLGIALGQRMQATQGDAVKLQETVDHIVTIIFGKATAPAVSARLTDPDDDLDFTHVMELMNALVEKATGTPTT